MTDNELIRLNRIEDRLDRIILNICELDRTCIRRNEIRFSPPENIEEINMQKIERCQEILENLGILSIRPNDILILSFSEHISSDHAENLQNQVREWGITNRVVILDGGIKLGLLREENETT